jgi:tetratricopeptide (TPR) repeat protein
MGRFEDALQAATQSIAAKPHPSNLALKIWMQMSWQGDLDGALATSKSMSVDDQLDDIGLITVVSLYRWRREPGNVLKTLAPITRDWLTWSVRAPKAALAGDAFEELGQMDAARAEWRKALKSANDRLVMVPNDRWSLEWKAYLSAALGDNAASRQAWKQATGLPRVLGPLSIERLHRVSTSEEIIAELEYRASAPAASDSRMDLRKGGLERRPFISAADLRLNPAWDKVRHLARFKALQAKLDADPRFTPTPTNVSTPMSASTTK